MLKLIHINKNQVSNQQRFPIKIYGWPLYEASKIIIEKRRNCYKNAENLMQNFIKLRSNMNTLEDLYGLKELKKWNINSSFIPWFSKKPIFNSKIKDLDYTEHYLDAEQIIKELDKLIKSIKKKKFLNKEVSESILVYPITKNKKNYYIRQGNHRTAILASLGYKIPCYLDQLNFLKPRSLQLITSRKFYIGPKLIYKNYPNILSVKKWPCVISGNISKKTAINIYKLFKKN